mgnify:CR=1 FL=1
MVKTVGILTSGGDSPGLNAAIRGVGMPLFGERAMDAARVEARRIAHPVRPKVHQRVQRHHRGGGALQLCGGKGGNEGHDQKAAPHPPARPLQYVMHELGPGLSRSK